MVMTDFRFDGQSGASCRIDVLNEAPPAPVRLEQFGVAVLAQFKQQVVCRFSGHGGPVIPEG